MTAVSVRELNANVSAIVARVEAGESMTITKRGRRIAALVPLSRNAQPDLSAISVNQPYARGTPEWQAAYDRMTRRLDDGYNWGGRVTYEDKHE